jgi:protease-4
MRCRLAVVALALSLLAAAAAPAGARSSRGLLWPGSSLVVSDDASALSLNPGGLGFLEGGDLRYVHTTLDDLAGEGDGVFLAARLLGPWAIGMGFEFLPIPGLSERALRYTFGTAFGFGRTVSFGLNLHHFTSDASPALDGLLSVDVGLMVRPLSWLAVGLTAEDLNTPVLSGVRIDRRYGLGLGFRPGTDRVLLTTEVVLEEQSWDVDTRVRLDVEPLRGLVLGGDLGLAPRGADVQVFVGAHLTLSFGYVGATGGVFLGGRNDADFDGFTVGVRASTRSFHPLVRRGGQAVVLTLSGELPEEPTGGLFTPRRPAFAEVVRALDGLRGDPRVDAVVLELRGYDGGWAQTQELRAVLADLRAAGTKVITHCVTPDSREYLLASAADRVVLHPAGGLFLTGLAVVTTYVKQAFDALGVQAQFVAIGDWKSFPETFTRGGPSDPAAAQRDRLLDGLWQQLLAALGESRGRPAEELRGLVDGGPYGAEQALALGLVDATAYDDELGEQVEAVVGHPVVLRRDWFQPTERTDRWGPREHVAVVPIVGSIVDGESATIPFLGMRFTGSGTVERALQAAVGNPSALGIVVRVDSPGGSSIASARMHRAIRRAAEKKPLVVSFGNQAASGGYYAGVGGPRILADPATATGSIGIFAGKFVVRDLLAKLGVDQVITGRGEHAAFFSSARPWTDEELRLIAERLGSLYEQFLAAVAEGRKRSRDEVHAVAQGQVWLGTEALERGLVDELGGVREALRELNGRLGRAAEELPPLAWYPEPGLLQRLGVASAEAGALVAPTVVPPGAAPAPADGGDAREAAALPLPPALVAAARTLAPFLAPFAAHEPLALVPVRYDIR